MNSSHTARSKPQTALWLAAFATSTALGQEAATPAGATDSTAQSLPRVVVVGESEADGIVQQPNFAPVEATKIYSGKKASVIDLDSLPKVHANNYRQALTRTPGLLYSEEATPLVSLGYRGIGDPHRSQFIQVLKDGIPIHADPFGYPEAYYTPPLDVVDRLEFIRGGASLMYGPQTAGALNYVTYQPRRDREFAFRTQNVGGSDALFSNYSAVDGTVGRVGYLAYFNYRRSDGLRSANSDYELYGGHFKTVLDADGPTRWTLAMDAYEESHGEPGGLSRAAFESGSDEATRLYDRFQLRRYVPALTLEHDLSDRTLVEVRTWGGYYDRYSRRQRGGGFGTAPTGSDAQTNDIERQEFYTFGIEPRLRHDWEAWGEEHTLATGVHFYRGHSPRTDRRGAAPNATEGVLRSASERDSIYGSVFAENRFQMGDFSVTPGFRLENLHQDVMTRIPGAGGSETVTTKDRTDVEPLFSLAAAYSLPAETELYASVARSYRPLIFTESIIPGSGTIVAGDVDPATGMTYETGFRGSPRPWTTFDVSVFLVDVDERFGGTVTSGGQTLLRNVGQSVNYGLDLAAEIELLGLADALAGSQDEREHTLSLYGNLSLLEAELRDGAFEGNTPQYSPQYLVRTGLIWEWKNRVKVAAMGTFVDQHFATDDENPTREIPSYVTWDLTAEINVYRDTVKVIAGLNNIFDERYTARIRGDGIDPAAGRNFYAGLGLSF